MKKLFKDMRNCKFAFAVLLGMCMLNFMQGMQATTLTLFYHPISDGMGVPLTSVTMYSTIQTLAASLLMTPIGKLLTNRSGRICALAGVITGCLACLTCALSPNIYVMWITGIFPALMTDIILFILAPSVLPNWFKTGAATVQGLVLAFRGGAGVIAAPLVSSWILNYGWRQAYIMLTVAMLVVGLPFALLCIVKSPAEKGLMPIGYEEAEAVASAKAAEGPKTIVVSGLDQKKAPKTLALYLCMFCAGAWSFAGIFQNFIVTYCYELGYGTIEAGIIAAAINAGQTIGYFGSGILFDSLKMKKTLTFMCGIPIITYLCLLYINGNVTILAIAGFLAMFGYSGKQVVMANTVREIFGMREYSGIYGWVASCNLFVAALAFTAWAALVERIGYQACMWIAIIIFALIIIAGHVCQGQAKKIQAEWRDEVQVVKEK